MFIAFSFGAFIEGAAGVRRAGGRSGAMLAGLGFDPSSRPASAAGEHGACRVRLDRHPVTTLANVTGLPVAGLSAMVGRLCAMISVLIPGYLIVVMTGWKRAVEVLPAIIACGVSFAGMQFYVSTTWAELTDIMSSLTCIVVMVLVMKFWKPESSAARG